VTPTKAAAQRATATIVKISLVFICFSSHTYWGWGVWRLAETEVKQFQETVFETMFFLKLGVLVGKA
jgi:hypothetical protein